MSRPVVVLVDDEKEVLKSFRREFAEMPFDFRLCETAEEARDLMAHLRVDILICDQRMPGMSGMDMLTWTREHAPRTIRILMSGFQDIDVFVSAINRGQIYHYLPKPWEAATVRRILTEAAEALREFDETEQIRSMHLEKIENWKARFAGQTAVNSLRRVVMARDPDLYHHSVRVSQLAAHTARHLLLEEDRVHFLETACILHDLGKIAIKDAILFKEGRLDEREFDEMKRHPTVGADILRELGTLSEVADIVEQHHERIDGQGYPKGLSGDQILIESRILAVCDAYDALISDRVYRKGMPGEEAFGLLKKNCGHHFDCHVVTALEQEVVHHGQNHSDRG